MPPELKFTETAEEYWGAQRVFNQFFARPFARFMYRYAIPIGLLLLAEGALGFFLGESIGLSIFVVVLGGYVISSVTIFGPRRIKKEFAQYPDRGSERVMTLGEENIFVQTSHGKSEMAWERFSRFVETDKLFVLLAPPRFLLTIPKRVVPATELDQLRELLRRKLPVK
jgi:hypothetical protein